jgi:hypothetical protein
MYCRKPGEILRGELREFFKQKGTKAAKNPFGYTREYLCFVRCLLFKTKVVSASRRCNGREATARLSNQYASRVGHPEFTSARLAVWLPRRFFRSADRPVLGPNADRAECPHSLRRRAF